MKKKSDLALLKATLKKLGIKAVVKKESVRDYDEPGFELTIKAKDSFGSSIVLFTFDKNGNFDYFSASGDGL